MPISGLVVSLKSDPQLREEAITAIRQEKRIEIGLIQSRRMAIVLDTASTDEDKQLWCWLSSLPGVVLVDVAMVGFDEPGHLEQPGDRLKQPGDNREAPCESATTPCNAPNPRHG